LGWNLPFDGPIQNMCWYFFCVNQKSKMATTAGHSFFIWKNTKNNSYRKLDIVLTTDYTRIIIENITAEFQTYWHDQTFLKLKTLVQVV